MEQKNFLGIFEKFQSLFSREISFKIIRYLAYLSISLISTQAISFGKYSPFAIAVVSACPKNMLWISTFGAIFGYLLPSTAYLPFRYIVAVITVVAIRWTMNELKKINSSDFFAPVISFIPLVSTGITMSLINNSAPTTTALYIAESFLAASAAYFYKRTMRIFSEKKYRFKFDNIDIASISVSFAILILALNEVEIITISIGRILMILLVLVSAYYGGISGGAISGICAGAISGLSKIGLAYLSGAYGLGGLMAGIFAPTSKLVSTIAFIISHGVASLQISNTTNIYDSVIEVAVASTFFIIMPELKIISEFFSLRRDNLSDTSLRDNVVMRLNHSSNALLGISDTVEEISEKLVKSTSANITQVFNHSASEVCAACMTRALCWNKNREKTIQHFCKLSKPLKEKGRVDTADFTSEFQNTCSRVGEMRESVNKFYKNFISKQKEEVRMKNFRDIACEQFKVTSAMLTDMANEISLYENYDEETAQRVSEVFKRLDIFAYEVCCRRDKNNRLTIEAELEKRNGKKLSKAQFVREISKACGKSFASPCISTTENNYKITMTQKPLLDIKIGVAQSSADKLCGDSAVSFFDGQGNYIAMISDGMGTGGLAAVDGTMTSSIMESLLKAGMGYNTALKLINSALMSKSEDETLATVDMISLDLFTGKCDFRKAGAAISVVKKSKKAVVIETNSLPIGIMHDVTFASQNINLKAGDIICLFSDGVIACGQDWISETVENFIDTDPELLARQIVEYAKKSRNDGKNDDITALVIMVTENV